MRPNYFHKFNVVVVEKTGLTYHDDEGYSIGPVCKVRKVIHTDDYNELKRLMDESRYVSDVEFFDTYKGERITMNDKEKKIELDKTRRYDGYTIMNYPQTKKEDK